MPVRNFLLFLGQSSYFSLNITLNGDTLTGWYRYDFPPPIPQTPAAYVLLSLRERTEVRAVRGFRAVTVSAAHLVIGFLRRNSIS